MWKPLLISLLGLAAVGCSTPGTPVRSSPERIVYDYHWPAQVERLTLDANRYCDKFDKQAFLERQDLLTLTYSCK